LKRLADQTLYEILEVASGAQAPEIESAYERIRALYAPGSLATYSLMTPEEASLLTSRIEDAKTTLLDPDARSRYDAGLAAPEAGQVRAAANGTNGASTPAFGALPPVIPAMQAPALGSEPSPSRTPVPPAIERAAVEPAAAPPADPPAIPPAIPGPIRLDREILVPVAAAPVQPDRAPAPVPTAIAAPPAPEEVPLPEGAAWSGVALRRVREARGVTIPQIAERTKVTRHHIENIEEERFSALPAPVYLRGILLALARELRLDGQKVARAYLDRAAAAGKPR
jgi:hypothetical protein